MLTINQFLPKYCSVLLRDDYREYVSEIIIEGHTDTKRVEIKFRLQDEEMIDEMMDILKDK